MTKYILRRRLAASVGGVALAAALVACTTGTPWTGTPPVMFSAASFEQFTNIAEGNIEAVDAAAADCADIARSCAAANRYCTAISDQQASVRSELSTLDFYKGDVAAKQESLAILSQFDPVFASLDLDAPSNAALRDAFGRVNAAADLLAGTGFADIARAVHSDDRAFLSTINLSPADIGFYATGLINALTEFNALLSPKMVAFRTASDDLAELAASATPGSQVAVTASNLYFRVSNVLGYYELQNDSVANYLTSAATADARGVSDPISDLPAGTFTRLSRFMRSVESVLDARDDIQRMFDDAVAARENATGSDSSTVRLLAGDIESAADRASAVADQTQIFRGEAQRNLLLAAQACGVDTPPEYAELPLETPFDEWIDIPAASNTFWDWSSP